MNVKTLQTDGCRRVLDVELREAERFAEAYREAYRVVGQKVQVPGYRRGKAPRDVIERYHGESADEEALRQLISTTYREVMNAQELIPVSAPEVYDVEYDGKTSLRFKLRVDVKPTIKLKRYEQIKLKDVQAPSQVTDSEIDALLNEVREQRKRLVPSENEGEKHMVLPDLDDAFAQEVGFEDLTALRTVCRQNLQQRKWAQAYSMAEEALVDELIRRARFDVPVSLVNARTQELQRVFAGGHSHSHAGHSHDHDAVSEPTEQTSEDQLRVVAERQVRTALIVEEIAAREEKQAEEVLPWLLESTVKQWKEHEEEG